MYVHEDESATIMGFLGDPIDTLVIPDVLDGYSVTDISNDKFMPIFAPSVDDGILVVIKLSSEAYYFRVHPSAFGAAYTPYHRKHLPTILRINNISCLVGT